MALRPALRAATTAAGPVWTSGTPGLTPAQITKCRAPRRGRTHAGTSLRSGRRGVGRSEEGTTARCG
jgi:hypothetical protein